MTRALRSLRRPAAALSMLCAVAALAAACAGTGARPPAVEVPFEKYALPNGLEVILSEDHRLPIVGVNVWYHVGARNEVPGRTGFAHLFEHMMFQASGHVEEDQYFQILQAAGASIVNGSTNFERTNYLEDVPAHQLETALWLESDRMGFLLDRLDEPMLARQQDVVRNERRQRVENAPYGLALERVFNLLFPKEHPYHARVIGSHEDIQAAGLADVRDFFTRYYCPNNATLCIVGDIDVAATKQLVAKYFGTIPRGQPVPPVEAVTPPIAQERREVITDKVELPRVYMAWLTAPVFGEGNAEGDVLAQVLGGGRSSRLHRSLVYDRQLAQSVNAACMGLSLGSVFMINATAKPGHTAEELEAAIAAELAALAEQGPTADELAAARNSLWSGAVLPLENVGSFGGVADALNHYNHYLGDPGKLGWDLARYAAVTPAAVRDLVTRDLRRDARVVVHCVPGPKVVPPGPPAPPFPEPTTARAESAEPWRDTQPTAAPARPLALPPAQRFTLDNGLPVYVVENHQLPVVAAQLVVRAGSAADPAGREGLAAFAAAMLDEGTPALDAMGIARRLDGLGCNLDTGSDTDGSYVVGSGLRQNAEALLGLMADVVLRPTFPDNEVERVRNDRLTSLLQTRDNPGQIAQRVGSRLLYGESHPYGHVPLGTEAALRAISRDDLAAFHAAVYTPANAALVLAGDLTEAHARRLAQQTFGDWHGGDAARPVAAPPQPAPNPGVVIVDLPGATQTTLNCGHVAVARSHPDYEALRVMNMILGGNFSSRLNMNLREDKGYTYGARTNLGERLGAAPFVAVSNVQGDKTGASVIEVLREFNRIRAEAPTESELALAKEAILSQLPATFQGSGDIAGAVGNLFLFDLPADYYETMPGRIRAVTTADVVEMARRHVHPERVTILLVGDLASVRPQLDLPGRGPVIVLAADGAPAAGPAGSAGAAGTGAP